MASSCYRRRGWCSTLLVVWGQELCEHLLYFKDFRLALQISDMANATNGTLSRKSALMTTKTAGHVVVPRFILKI